jgi:predicted nuclease of predicted toxin-antitoxin system
LRPDKGKSLTDSEVWAHAKANDLVIVTKDSDFSYRIATTDPPPHVVPLRIGNLRSRELRQLIEVQWPQIEFLLATAKLINVYDNRIEAVS